MSSSTSARISTDPKPCVRSRRWLNPASCGAALVLAMCLLAVFLPTTAADSAIATIICIVVVVGSVSAGVVGRIDMSDKGLGHAVLLVAGVFNFLTALEVLFFAAFGVDLVPLWVVLVLLLALGFACGWALPPNVRAVVRARLSVVSFFGAPVRAAA